MPGKKASSVLPNSDLHILISGYYGFNNLGDEAILTAIHQTLTRECPNVVLTVLSANPEWTTKIHKVRAISRTDYAAIWRELGQCQILISGGGSLLQDVTSSRSLQYYLMILIMSWLRRTPYMIYCQGIGPIQGKWNRFLTSLVLKRAVVLTVRDQESLEELVRLGVSKSKMQLSADPVLLFQPPAIKTGRQILSDLGVKFEEGPIVGVSVRPWEREDHWIDELAAALDHLVLEDHAQIIFIPMHQQDDEVVAQKICAKMQSPTQAHCLPHGHTIEEVLSIIEACHLLIGVRLHALVFAAIVNTRAIAIRYDPKIDHFAQRVGQTLAGSLAELQRDELLLLIRKTLQEPVDQATSQQKVDELRRQARLSATLAIAMAKENKQ